MNDLKLVYKKIYTWRSALSWQDICLLVLVLIIGFPSLFVSWMIIDDGVSILMAEKISGFLTTFDFTGIWNIFLEKESGRFRPGYWLFQWVTYILAGKNPSLHHLIHLLISGGTVFLIYSIIRILTSSKSAALMGGLLFLMASFNIENWYRLGTAEPMITFYIALSLYFMTRNIYLVKKAKKKPSKRYLLFSVLPLVPAYFTKETFFVFLPFTAFLIPCAFLLKNQTEKKVWIRKASYFLLANLILMIISLIIVVMVRQQGYYSSYYTASVQELIGHARGYLGLIIKTFGLFFWVFLFSFLIFSILAIKKKKFTLNQLLQIAFIVGFLSFFAIQLPWAFVLGRYLEPALVFLVIVFGFEAARIFGAVSRYSNQKISFSFWKANTRMSISASSIKLFGLILALFWLFLVNIPSIFNYTLDTFVGHRNIKELLTFIAHEAPQKGRVFFNLKRGNATIELVFEAGLHLNLFYNRPDLVIDYLDTEGGEIRETKAGDIIVTAFVSDNFIAYKEENLSKMMTIKNTKTLQHKIFSIAPISSFFSQTMKSYLYNIPKPNLYNLHIRESEWRIDKVI